MPKAGIVGSGLIGRCWSVLFARAGWSVSLFDIQAAQLEAGLAAVRSQLEELAEADLLRGQSVDEVFARVSTTSDLSAAIGDADYVQECTPESLDLKRKVFKNLDEACGENTILASSTSCIAPSTFTEELKHRANCIVSHPVNPPVYIPVVEVVPAPWTSEAVAGRVREIMLELGQAPVMLRKEVNGFIINRLQYALLMEAWRLVSFYCIVLSPLLWSRLRGEWEGVSVWQAEHLFCSSSTLF